MHRSLTLLASSYRLFQQQSDHFQTSTIHCLRMRLNFVQKRVLLNGFLRKYPRCWTFWGTQIELAMMKKMKTCLDTHEEVRLWHSTAELLENTHQLWSFGN
jgi:hypothetical protein